MYKLCTFSSISLFYFASYSILTNIVSDCAARLCTSSPFIANKMLTLLEKACIELTSDNWRKVVEKIKKLCYDDWNRYVWNETIVDQPLLINAGDSSCSSGSIYSSVRRKYWCHYQIQVKIYLNNNSLTAFVLFRFVLYLFF